MLHVYKPHPMIHADLRRYCCIFVCVCVCVGVDIYLYLCGVCVCVCVCRCVSICVWCFFVWKCVCYLGLCGMEVWSSPYGLMCVHAQKRSFLFFLLGMREGITFE